jgi:hypothetical protein
MENNGSDKNQQQRRRIVFHRVRPKYKKILIPFLILSLIVAIILIWATNKYLFKPLFQGKGSLHRTESRLLALSGNRAEDTLILTPEWKNNGLIGTQCWRKT